MPKGFTGRKKKKNVIEQLKDIKAKGGAEAEVKPEPKEEVKPKTEPETMREGVIKSEETGELTGIKLPGRDPIVGIPPEEVRFLAEKHRAKSETPAGQVDLTAQAAAERGEEERRAGFEAETGALALQEELRQKILAPPEGEPERGLFATLFLPTTEEGERRRLEVFGTTSKLPAIAAALTAGLAAPLIAKGGVSLLTATAGAAAKAGITANSGVIQTVVAGLGLALVGPKVLDFRGDEMEVLRAAIQRVTEDGEKLESAVRNGFPSTDSIDLIQQMSDDVDSAESRIKDLANLNVQYRFSKEWKKDRALMRTARLSLERRVIAVQNIAATGIAALNPDELLFNANQF